MKSPGRADAAIALAFSAFSTMTPGAADAGDAPADLLSAPRWTWGVRLDEAWNTNVRFDSRAEGSVIQRASAALGHDRSDGRRTMSASVRGSGALYSAPGLDAATYGANLALTQLIGPRATVSFTGATDRTYASEYGSLSNEGLVYPSVLVTGRSATAGVGLRASPRVTLGTNVRWQQMSFERSLSSPPLADGTMAAAAAFVTSRIAPRDSLVVSYEFGRSDGSVEEADMHSVTAGWRRAIETRLVARLDAGVTRLGSTPGVEPAVTPRIVATLAVNARRSTVDFRYAHGIDHAFGLGRHRSSDVLAFRCSSILARRLRASIAGAYGRTRLTGAETAVSNAVMAGAEIARTIGRGIDVVGAYSFRGRSDSGTAPAIAAHNVSVSFSYSREWRP